MNVNNDSFLVGYGSETFWGFSGSARQMVVLRQTVVTTVIVDAFADIYSHFPCFSSVPASTVVKIMDQKREPTRKFVWQGLLSDCRVIFTRVNKIEAMYGRSRISVKVERGSTFTFIRGLSYIASISFTCMHLNFACVRKEKLRDSANQPLLSRARRKKQSNTNSGARDEHSARDRQKEK